jgi:signal transduction histidine kinase/ActR/RegA family two-component response regulator
MRENMDEKEYQILRKAVSMELDFVVYLDVATRTFRTITMNDQRGTLPMSEGKYDEMLPLDIEQNFYKDDKEDCGKCFELDNIIGMLEEKDVYMIQYRIVVGKELYHKQTKIYYQDETRDTIVFVCGDVTDSYRSSELQKVRLYQAMLETKRANKAKSEFLISMSHEIRTPLNSIIGLAYLSREHIGNSSQVLDNIEKIESSAQFMRSVVDDSLNLSQIESGNIALHELDTDFANFLINITAKTREDAMTKGVHFLAENRGAFAKQYHFDADNLGEAIGNVLQNSVRYTNPGGKITFITELLSESDDEAQIRFEIRDDGEGISDEFLPHIFEPFAQETKKTATLDGGTGLGLSITKNIIEMMGGKIDVYSKKNEGSTFVIAVKLASVNNSKTKAGQGSGAYGEEYNFDGKRVLLVEDNEINVEITKHILEHKNFEVDVAYDGQEAVDAFLGHPEGYYNAILMDIRMPNMDGLEATRLIRASDRQDHYSIPIIAMTANAFEEDVHKSLEAGMDAHLSKPVDIKQIYQTLDRLIYR